MKKTLILSVLLGLLVGSSYFFVNNYLAVTTSHHQQHHDHEKGLVHAVLDSATNDEIAEMAEIILIGKTKNYADTILTPGDIPFTEVEFKVEEVIFNKQNTEIPKDLLIFHEGAEDYFYHSFRLPEKNVDYLLFLSYAEELGGYQIKYPNSKLEIIKVNGEYRVIEPVIKKELENYYGHKNYENMDEFKDDVYVISKSTGEKVKLTASEDLKSKKERIKKIKEKDKIE